MNAIIVSAFLGVVMMFASWSVKGENKQKNILKRNEGKTASNYFILWSETKNTVAKRSKKKNMEAKQGERKNTGKTKWKEIYQSKT